MDDKRIKLITKEMSIAWGLISLGSTLPFMFLCSCYGPSQYLSSFETVVFVLLNISAILAQFFAMFCFVFFSSYGTVEIVVVSCLVTIFQVTLYWFIGIFLGNFIIKIKHSRKELSPEPAPPAEPTQD